MELPSASLRRFALPLLAAAAIFAAYANHFQNSFHFDDFHTIVDNPAVRSLGNVPRFFRDATAFSVLPANRTYRPVLSTTLALDYWIAHGYSPAWFHADSFVLFFLQLGCMGLLFGSVLKVASPWGKSRNRTVALVAVTWYGLHPAVAETVNYIIQRGDILSTLGVVAALALYVRNPGWRRAGIYLIPLALGMLSKPPAMVFPGLLLAYLWLFGDEAERRPGALAGAVAPSLALTAGLLWFEARMTPRSFAPSDVSEASYLLTQPMVAMRYFGSWFFPVHLNVDTDLEPLKSVDLAEICGVLFLVGLGIAIFFAANSPKILHFAPRSTTRTRIWRPVAFGLLWFVLGLLPTSLYRLSEVENDHRMYLPFAGLALAVTYSLALAVEYAAGLPCFAGEGGLRVRRIAGALTVVLTIAALALYGYGTHLRNQVWRTEETLWLDDVRKSPHNGRGLMIYGLTQMNQGRLPRALDYFQRAEVYTPNYATLQINLGIVHGALGDRPAAERHFQRALALAPADDLPHLYYGRWLLAETRTEEAISQLRTALLLNPSRVEPHTLLTQAYVAEGSFDEARAAANETLALDPNDATARALIAGTYSPGPDAWINRSLAEYRQGRFAESIVSARRALALRPDSAEAWNNVGAGYAALKQWDEAIKADEEAVRLRPDLQLARNNLAWAESQKAGTGKGNGKGLHG